MTREEKYDENMAKIIAAIIAIVVHPVLMMVGWNYAVTTVFGMPEISYLQSLAIWCVARMLFGK